MHSEDMKNVPTQNLAAMGINNFFFGKYINKLK